MAKWQKLKNNLELQEDPFLKFDMIDQRIIYVFFLRDIPLRRFCEKDHEVYSLQKLLPFMINH